MSVLLYYAHPGEQHSRANIALAKAAQEIEGITFVDLYRDYPRFDIDPDKEQERLLEHDVILFQFPFFWYSTPSIIKEWFDLVLEHGFAYGDGGTHLKGKTMMVALTAAGSQDAYSTEGYQNFPIRSFLTPLEQTARLCQMEFATPFVLFGSLSAINDGRLERHVTAYRTLLLSIRDGRHDFHAGGADVLTFENPILQSEL